MASGEGVYKNKYFSVFNKFESMWKDLLSNFTLLAQLENNNWE